MPSRNAGGRKPQRQAPGAGHVRTGCASRSRAVPRGRRRTRTGDRTRPTARVPGLVCHRLRANVRCQRAAGALQGAGCGNQSVSGAPSPRDPPWRWSRCDAKGPSAVALKLSVAEAAGGGAPAHARRWCRPAVCNRGLIRCPAQCCTAGPCAAKTITAPNSVRSCVAAAVITVSHGATRTGAHVGAMRRPTPPSVGRLARCRIGGNMRSFHLLLAAAVAACAPATACFA